MLKMVRIDCDVLGYKFHVYDFEKSISHEYIMRDIREQDMYKLKKFNGIDGNILDVGANIGIMSILFAKMFPSFKIYAIEPLKCSYNNLCKAISENGTSNIFAYNLAVGDENTECYAAAGEEMSGGAHCYKKFEDIKSYATENTVRMVTPKELFKIIGISRFALLKMDCEGGEHGFFKSLTDKEIDDCFEHITAEFHGHEAGSLVARIKDIKKEKAALWCI